MADGRTSSRNGSGFAGDAVVVAIQPGSVSGISAMQRGYTGSPRLGAVRIGNVR